MLLAGGEEGLSQSSGVPSTNNAPSGAENRIFMLMPTLHPRTVTFSSRTVADARQKDAFSSLLLAHLPQISLNKYPHTVRT
jgi:hypothetical protein